MLDSFLGCVLIASWCIEIPRTCPMFCVSLDTYVPLCCPHAFSRCEQRPVRDDCALLKRTNCRTYNDMQPKRAFEDKERHRLLLWKKQSLNTCQDVGPSVSTTYTCANPPAPNVRLPGNRAISALSAAEKARKERQRKSRKTVAKTTPNLVMILRSTGAKASWRGYRRRCPLTRVSRNHSSFWPRT